MNIYIYGVAVKTAEITRVRESLTGSEMTPFLGIDLFKNGCNIESIKVIYQ